MRKYLLSSMLGLLGILGAAHAQSIPASAKSTLAKLHPQATGIKWDQEDGGYEASFNENGKAMSVTMDGQGKLQETETDIAVTELPITVRNYVAKQMPSKKIKEAAIIVDADGKKMYEAEVGGKDLLFDMTGKFIR